MSFRALVFYRILGFSLLALAGALGFAFIDERHNVVFLLSIGLAASFLMFGEILVLRRRADSKTCPQCAESVRKEALKCRFCAYDFSPPPAAEDAAPASPSKPFLTIRFQPCPQCSRKILNDAGHCPFCGCDLSQKTSP